VVHWRRRSQTTPVSLPPEPHKQYEKAKKKKSDTGIRAPRSESVQYATGEKQGAITNSSRKNGEAGPEWKGHLVMAVCW